MKATFDFRDPGNCEDCSNMFMAFGWPFTFSGERSSRIIVHQFDPNTFGAMAGEAAVFAPVQITVE